MPLANEVNVHEYKPAFKRKNGELLCYVATPDSRDQILHAWRMLSYGELTTVADESAAALDQTEQVLRNTLGSLPSSPRSVLIARLDSFVFAHKIVSDYSSNRIGAAEARHHLAGREQTRLSHHFRGALVTNGQLYDTDTVVRSAWLPEQELFVINLPWGPLLSQRVARTIAGSTQGNVSLIGGAGAINPRLEVESVFAASSIRTADYGDIVVNNRLVASLSSLEEQFGTGLIGSVTSALGNGVRRSNSELDAVETEVAYMSSLYRGDRSFGCLHYIMDNPAQSLPLSKTYYDADWLKALAASARRAKNICYAAALRYYGLSHSDVLLLR